MEYTLPFRAYSAANWIAMMAQRHFHEYGTTREQLAWIALNARRNAAGNPNAIYRDPLSLDDYLAARMISTPFCLFDCDVPCDGATAMIVSRADRARDLRRPPLRVEAVGSALRGRPSWDQFDDLTTMALRDAAKMLWERTDLRPSDVDVAELYDGFSFIALAWLEALGFCKKGEGGPFIDGGARIALDGEIPLNTERRSALGRPAARLRLPARGVRPALGRRRRASGARRSARGGRRRGRRSARRVSAARAGLTAEYAASSFAAAAWP